MKKILIISLFVLGLIIPNINVKAVDVSNEQQLREVIEQGGDITLTQNIEIKKPLVIDKDVNISGKLYYILMQGDDTLMTINSGNVILDVGLLAGWNGEYKYGTIPDNAVKGQGTALEINGGTINIKSSDIFAGNVGIEVNGGTVTGNPPISGGQGMIVNGGNVDLDYLYINSGGTALTVNNGANVTLDGAVINSYEENGIEVNDGSVVNINSTRADQLIFGIKNAIYLNGGSINLNGPIGLSSSTEGKGIYINKGVNTVSDKDVLNLGKDFVFSYEEGTTPNFSIYVNPDIQELKVTDEKNFMELLDNKLSLGFCSKSFSLAGPNSQSEEERKATCSALGNGANYDGPIYSNELGKCTTVYINGVKQNEPDASCTPVAEDENTENNQGPQIVEVPSTSAYGSIIIIVLGITCVIVSVFVMRKVTKKEN